MTVDPVTIIALVTLAGAALSATVGMPLAMADNPRRRRDRAARNA